MRRRKKKKEQKPREGIYGMKFMFTGPWPMTVTPWSPEMKEKMCGKPAPVPEVARRLFTI